MAVEDFIRFSEESNRLRQFQQYNSDQEKKNRLLSAIEDSLSRMMTLEECTEAIAKLQQSSVKELEELLKRLEVRRNK